MKVSLTSTTYSRAPEWVQSDHKMHLRGGVTIDSDLVAAVNGKKEVKAGTPIGYHSGNDRWGPYVADFLVTGTVASNNAIRWTSRKPGKTVKVAILNNGASKPLAVSINGDTVEVQAATDAGGLITSTAAQVIAAVNAHLLAQDIVKAANESTSTGAGVVAAVAATALTGSNGIVPEALLFEDVDVTNEDVAAGALIHGAVLEARLPVEIDESVKRALPAILFV